MLFLVSQVVEEEGLVEAVRWEEVEEVLPWAEVGAGASAAGVEGDSRIVSVNVSWHNTIGWAQWTEERPGGTRAKHH